MRTGPFNLITDIAGLKVGNADDSRLRSGVTALICETPFIAAVDVRGGAPGTRETDLLAPERTVERIDALVLAGGSAFGLEAASGVSAALVEQGRGFAVGAARIPIVPGAILFDLLNGGDKNWGRFPPYRELGFQAATTAHAGIFQLGRTGAGFGATTADGAGGLGSASLELDAGLRIGALVAVNAVGSPTIGQTGHFWAATDEIGDEFGGIGLPHPWPADANRLKMKGQPTAENGLGTNTTIAVVATNAALTKAQARHLAVMAQDGLARAIRPIHTPLDGDTVFAIATGGKPGEVSPQLLATLGEAAASTLARACARAVFEATRMPVAAPRSD